MPKIPLEHLRKLFVYDREADFIRHNIDRPRDTFNTQQGYLQWRKKLAGKRAGTNTGNGRPVVGVLIGKRTINIPLHRVVYAVGHGVEMPDAFIDHINGDPCDNRLCNLRLVTASENSRNMATPLGRSGFRGAYRVSSGKYQARIMKNKTTAYLGTFDTAEQAHEAYLRAAEGTGRTDRHLQSRSVTS